MPLRSYVPFSSLVSAWQLKTAIALPTAWAIEWLAVLGSYAAQLLAAPPALIIGITMLLFADMITGIAAAIKRGERISSRAFRQTGWKVLEYSSLAFVGIVCANAFKDSDLHLITDSLDDAALLYIALTETMSVLENVTGSRAAARRLWRKVIGMRRDDEGHLIMEEIVSSEPARVGETSGSTTTSGEGGGMSPAPPLPGPAGRIQSAGEPEPPPLIPPSPLT